MTSPTTQRRYERLRATLTDRNISPISVDTVTQPVRVSETSSLLHVLRNTPPSTYQSTSVSPTHDDSFRPTMYAENALYYLIYGILINLFFILLGLLSIALSLEFQPNATWTVIFTPFWMGNFILFLATLKSFQNTRQLQKCAIADTSSNEPLLPLFRRILTLYIILLPIAVLILCSQMAFCARLQDEEGSFSVAFAPLIVIQLGFITRYTLCTAKSSLPCLGWTLLCCFTVLVAYQTNMEREYGAALDVQEDKNDHDNETIYDDKLPWIVVLGPLLALDLMMLGCITCISLYTYQGLYSLNVGQKTSLWLYNIGGIATLMGQYFFWEKVEYVAKHTVILPSVYLFTGLSLCSLSLCIIAIQLVTGLLASRGGAVPVPLRRTRDGWVPAHTGVHRWLLLGDVVITAKGKAFWNKNASEMSSTTPDRNNDSEVETDTTTFSFWRKKNREPLKSPDLSVIESQRHFRTARKMSGVYDDDISEEGDSDDVEV